MSLPFKVGDFVNIWIIGINKEGTYKILDIKDDWLLLDAAEHRYEKHEYEELKKYRPEIRMSGLPPRWVPITAIARVVILETKEQALSD